MPSTYPIHPMDMHQKVNCIFMTLEEFQALVLNLTDGLREIEYELEGIGFNDTEKSEEIDTYWNRSLNETLSEYFQVPVTSVHADDSDPIGIWICYKPSQTLFVKSTKPEIGTEYWKVTYPAFLDKEQIDKAIKMAIRYAQSYDYEEYDLDNKEDLARVIEAYDVHAKQVFPVRANQNGQAAFAYYLQTFYNCTVTKHIPEYDYEYEW